MRIRRRLVLLAVVVATAGMTLFAILLSGLLARGVSDDQDEALQRLASETSAIVVSVDPATLAGRAPLAPADLATSLDPFIVVVDAGRHRALRDRPPRRDAAADPGRGHRRGARDRRLDRDDPPDARPRSSASTPSAGRATERPGSRSRASRPPS